MKRFLELLLTAAVILACNPIEKPEKGSEEGDVSKQRPLLKLLELHDSGAAFNTVVDGADSLHILFLQSGRSVAFPHDDGIIAEACGEDGPATVENLQSGYISVGGTQLTVKYESKLSDPDAQPVYICWGGGRLDIYLNNGRVISFDRDGAVKNALPVVRIDTDDGKPVRSKTVYTNGTFTLETPGRWDGSLTEKMEIRGRGNSSWDMFEKKPYKIKLAEKHELPGMDSDRQWCLIANYSDKTLLRNTVAMEMSRIVEFDWTPGIMHVDVYLNGEYVGLYDLMENRKVSGSRVDIDIEKGDCYLEIGENLDEPVWWHTPIYRIPMEFKDPEKPGDELLQEMKDYLNRFEEALAGDDFADPVKGYAAYIDVDSFIRYFIVEETAKDWDGDFRRSVFLTKEKGGKLKIYHVWDFDIAMGNCFDGDLGDPTSPEGWYIRNFYHKTGGADTGPMYRLFQDPAFCARARELWDKAYPKLRQIPDFIDSEAALMGASVERNFQRWPILGRYVWPNAVVYETYDEEIDYLKKYLSDRIEWINANL